MTAEQSTPHMDARVSEQGQLITVYRDARPIVYVYRKGDVEYVRVLDPSVRVDSQ